MGEDKAKILAEQSARRRKEREKKRAQALALLASGVSAAAVGDRLGLTARCVRNYANAAKGAK